MRAEDAAWLSSLIARDSVRLRLLSHVAALDLPDCWIGAGFVRNAAWDDLHGRSPAPPSGDVDVIWFDCTAADATTDKALEERLREAAPSVAWSVKNQARMHIRNGDQPYVTTRDAVERWPETATSLAMRLVHGEIELMAPFGLDDLRSLLLRPTPAFAGDKLPIFLRRVEEKNWLKHWPRLRVVGPMHDGRERIKI